MDWPVADELRRYDYIVHTGPDSALARLPYTPASVLNLREEAMNQNRRGLVQREDVETKRYENRWK